MITLDRDLCFLDCETLGLDAAAPIWEFAAIRINRGGTRSELHCQLLHKAGNWLESLPDRFAADYRARFDIQAAVPPAAAAREIQRITDGAIIAGSNPAFDTERLTLLLARFNLIPGWHFHPLDIPSMVVGWVASLEFGASLEWKSDALSSVAGVPSSDYPRHTAMGDVQWCLAQWRAMTAPMEVWR